jgi:hypothetical protein
LRPFANDVPVKTGRMRAEAAHRGPLFWGSASMARSPCRWRARPRELAIKSRTSAVRLAEASPIYLALELQRAAAEMAGDDDQRFDGVMVFSATTAERRERLGDEITTWLGKHPQRVPVDTVVRLSSCGRRAPS